MIRQVRLSTALNRVIEKHLREDGDENWMCKEKWSCCAIQDALGWFSGEYKQWPRIEAFLRTLGLDLGGSAFDYLGSREEYEEGTANKFPEYNDQEARAMWLTFVIAYLKDNPEEDFLVKIHHK